MSLRSHGRPGLALLCHSQWAPFAAALIATTVLARPAHAGECLNHFDEYALAGVFFNPEQVDELLFTMCPDKEITPSAKVALRLGRELWARGVTAQLRRIAQQNEMADADDDADRRARALLLMIKRLPTRLLGTAEVANVFLPSRGDCLPTKPEDGPLTEDELKARIGRGDGLALMHELLARGTASQAIAQALRRAATPWGAAWKAQLWREAVAAARAQNPGLRVCRPLSTVAAFYQDAAAYDALVGCLTERCRRSEGDCNGIDLVRDYGMRQADLERLAERLVEQASAALRASTEVGRRQCKTVVEMIAELWRSTRYGTARRLLGRLRRPDNSLGQRFSPCATMAAAGQRLAQLTRWIDQAEPTREDPRRAYVRPWIQLAERQRWRIDGPANIREYPRGPCVGWAPDDAIVAVSRAWNDWVKVGVIKPRYGPPEAAPELIEGWTQTRNLRLADPSPGRSYDEAIVGPQLLPAPELPCPRRFPYGYRFAALNDEQQHRALQRFVWNGRPVPEQPAAISADDPAAEAARCIAIGPHRDRNLVNWCCR